VVVYEGKLGSLRRFKDDVREVQQGYECGITVENFNDLKAGDIIEAFAIDKVAAKLESAHRGTSPQTHRA
jgi:translation initiation factor IF-2